jgi:hypothetical protein
MLPGPGDGQRGRGPGTGSPKRARAPSGPGGARQCGEAGQWDGAARRGSGADVVKAPGPSASQARRDPGRAGETRGPNGLVKWAGQMAGAGEI